MSDRSFVSSGGGRSNRGGDGKDGVNHNRDGCSGSGGDGKMVAVV